jgi:hypothetical protein
MTFNTFSNYPCCKQDVKTWDKERARKHVLDGESYKGKHSWRASQLQIFRMVEKDTLFQTGAFHHVVPASPLSAAHSALYMQESWRVSKEKMDLGFFACKHCRQYSKFKFCKQVSIQMLSCCNAGSRSCL